MILYEKRTCQLYAYKRDGQFIAKLGAYGNAPLEYRTIPEVFVFQNIEEIHLFDERGRKILRYSFDMEFIGSIKLEIVPKAMAVYNNDYYICSYRNDDIRSLGGLDLIIRDPVSFNDIKALWEPVSFEEATDYDKDLLRTYKFFSNRDTLFFAKQTSNEIVIYSIFEGEVTRLLVINLKGDQEDIYDENSIVQFGAMYFAGYLRLFFQAGREIHYAYYNISSKTISNFRIVNDIDKGPDFFPMGSCEGGGYHGDDLKIPYFIDFWKYGESDNYYNQIQSKYPEREKWLKEIIPNSLEDNPWIMITLSE